MLQRKGGGILAKFDGFPTQRYIDAVSLQPYELIDTPEKWNTCLPKLQAAPRLAIDLEANSMHAYRERVCLMQVSTAVSDYIIDPLIDADWEPFGEIIADPNVEKVFHAAEYDLILLKREHDWQINNLFDTMWAARILGYERYGLANMIEQFYGVKLDKKYQRSNWCKRPLSPEQLAYAQNDTHYLFNMRDRLETELREANRWEEAQHIFAEQTIVTLPDTDFDPNGFWSISGCSDLSNRQQAILKALYIFRDKQAQRRDQPVFKVFNDRTLLELADYNPRSEQEMRSIYGMSRGQIRRYGSRLLAVINSARNDPPPPRRKRKPRPSEAVSERYDRLHTWRKETAQARGVESDVIISRDALWNIAKKNPTNVRALGNIPLVSDWRAERYGTDILSIL